MKLNKIEISALASKVIWLAKEQEHQRREEIRFDQNSKMLIEKAQQALLDFFSSCPKVFHSQFWDPSVDDLQEVLVDSNFVPKRIKHRDRIEDEVTLAAVTTTTFDEIIAKVDPYEA